MNEAYEHHLSRARFSSRAAAFKDNPSAANYRELIEAMLAHQMAHSKASVARAVKRSEERG